MQTITEFLALVPTFVWWVTGAIVAAVLVVTLVRAAVRAARNAWRSTERRPSLEDVLTIVAASIATGVSANGMWKFAGDKLHLDGPLRAVLFAFIEVAVITSAVRAKRSMRENYKAGIDGIAVWGLAALTAVLSSLDAHSVAETIFRLSAPLVAAWLWERGMSLERQRLTGLKRINWRLTPERILVRLGLAETTDRTAADVDAQRRLTRVALAADKVASAKPGSRAHRRALNKLKAQGRAMVTHTGVSSDETQQQYLMDQLGVSRNIDQLPTIDVRPFWEPADMPAPVTAPVTPATPEVTTPATFERPEPSRELVLVRAPEMVTVLASEVVTSSDHQSDQDADPKSDRERPDEQDNKDAEKWVWETCRGRNGSGRRPSKREVADRFGFSPGWGQNRIDAVQAKMTARGYVFQEDGTVLTPARAVIANGVESDHAADLPMTEGVV